MEEKNNTRDGYMESFGRTFNTAAQPAQGVGLTDEQRRIAVELLACFNSWEDDVRVLGNVRAADAANLLSAILARQTAPTSERTVLANIVGEVSHTVGGDCVFFVEKTDAIRVLKRGDRLSIVARSAPTLDSAQQGEDWTDEQIAAYDRAMCETAQQGEDEPPLPWMAEEYAGDFEAWLEWHDEEELRKEFLNYARIYHAHMMRKMGDGVDAAFDGDLEALLDNYGRSWGCGKYTSKSDAYNKVIEHINEMLAQARAAGAERAVPEGWTDTIDKAAWILDIYHGYLQNLSPINFDEHPYIPDIEGTAKDLRDILAAAPSPAAAKEGWKPLADDDKPDVTRKIDVVLTNGVTLENGDYRKIDWTQVRNWRYSPTQQTSAKVDAEGGEA